ncbi:hypothetical protein FJTKL_06266 [Diaporthe vaccinii]|uniref:Protein YIP n=1 Tax=Diaporthe vaccinii TaxID=105482 RepID=A0ABR4DTV1_9PEZI
MSGGAGYDAVVDVDDEGDLGHTDLQDDLEFHNSNFSESTPAIRKAPGSSGLPLPATASSSGKRYLWSMSFYAQFFDVDTSAVLQRCWAALFPRANFLDVLEGNPDLYGPFWIATTVVFILFLGGTISKYLATTGQEPFMYDFKLLSGMSHVSLYFVPGGSVRLLTSWCTQAPRASSTATPSSSPWPCTSRSGTSAPSPRTCSSAGRSTATPTSSGCPSP